MIHTGIFSAASFHSRYPEPETPPESGVLWIIVKGSGVGVTPGDFPTVLSPRNPADDGCTVERVQYLGHRGNTPVYTAELGEGTRLPSGLEYSGVRELFGKIPDEELALAGLAVQIIDFDRTTQFCGRCGAHTVQPRTERAKRCPACELITYVRLSPAVIVLVRNGDRILLARSPRFPQEMHSILAGFVEPGENLEHAVHREVKEETGIEVTGLRYFGSEPWPFPNSLMIGFVADYAGGEITVDNNEIVSAGWFDRENLPVLPAKMSIARALIDSWIENREI